MDYQKQKERNDNDEITAKHQHKTQQKQEFVRQKEGRQQNQPRVQQQPGEQQTFENKRKQKPQQKQQQQQQKQQQQPQQKQQQQQQQKQQQKQQQQQQQQQQQKQQQQQQQQKQEKKQRQEKQQQQQQQRQQQQQQQRQQHQHQHQHQQKQERQEQERQNQQQKQQQERQNQERQQKERLLQQHKHQQRQQQNQNVQQKEKQHEKQRGNKQQEIKQQGVKQQQSKQQMNVQQRNKQHQNTQQRQREHPQQQQRKHQHEQHGQYQRHHRHQQHHQQHHQQKLKISPNEELEATDSCFSESEVLNVSSTSITSVEKKEKQSSTSPAYTSSSSTCDSSSPTSSIGSNPSPIKMAVVTLGSIFEAATSTADVEVVVVDKGSKKDKNDKSRNNAHQNNRKKNSKNADTITNTTYCHGNPNPNLSILPLASASCARSETNSVSSSSSSCGLNHSSIVKTIKRRWFLWIGVAALVIAVPLLSLILTRRYIFNAPNNSNDDLSSVVDTEALTYSSATNTATDETNTASGISPTTDGTLFNATGATTMAPQIMTSRPTSTPLMEELVYLPSNLTNQAMNATYPPTDLPTIQPTETPSLRPTLAPTQQPEKVDEAAELIFYAIADVPYTMTERVMLSQYVSTIPRIENPASFPSESAPGTFGTPSKFVIHLGDIQKGNNPIGCTEFDYRDFAQRLLTSPAPVFVVPGDNEVADCDDPAEGLAIFRKVFVGFEDNWNHDLRVERQPGRTENFMFVENRVLFVGVNILGRTAVLNQTEWDERLSSEINWTLKLLDTHYLEKPEETRIQSIVIMGHADVGPSNRLFFWPLRNYMNHVIQNSIPLLYLHGNLHEWNYNDEFYGEGENMAYMTLTGGVREAPTKILIDSSRFGPLKAGTNVTTGAFKYDRFWDHRNENLRRLQIQAESERQEYFRTRGDFH